MRNVPRFVITTTIEEAEEELYEDSYDFLPYCEKPRYYYWREVGFIKYIIK